MSSELHNKSKSTNISHTALINDMSLRDSTRHQSIDFFCKIEASGLQNQQDMIVFKQDNAVMIFRNYQKISQKYWLARGKAEATKAKSLDRDSITRNKLVNNFHLFEDTLMLMIFMITDERSNVLF